MTDENLTVPGEPVEVKRSFTDRWFSWPWCPWKKTRSYIPRWPDRGLYMTQDPISGEQMLSMHPTTLEILIAAIEKDTICQM